MCKCQPARFRQVLIANVTTKVSGRVSVPLDRVLKLRLPPSQVEREESLRPAFGWITGNLCDLSKGFCHDISEIAVGTLITERPPHRTERAPFGHSAPTLGV